MVLAQRMKFSIPLLPLLTLIDFGESESRESPEAGSSQRLRSILTFGLNKNVVVNAY
jgi:hypothetical protein